MNSLPTSRLQQLKAIVKQCAEAADRWVEALREIKESKLYLDEADNWDEWCRQNMGRTADSIRVLLWRDSKRQARELIGQTTREAIEVKATVTPIRDLSTKQGEISKTMSAKLLPDSEIHYSSPPKPPPIGVRCDIEEALRDANKLTNLPDLSLSSMHVVQDLIRRLRRIEAHLVQGEFAGFADQIPPKQRKDRAGSKEEVLRFFAAEMELPPTDAEWFFHKCEGSGWRNDGQPMADWKGTCRSWKYIKVFPSQKATVAVQVNGAPKPKTVFELKTILDSKQKLAADLKNRYCSEGPISDTWRDAAKKSEYWELRKEMRFITQEISRMA